VSNPRPDDPVDVDDLVDDPRTDVEALALGALLWAPAAEARRVTAVLTGADFARPITPWGPPWTS